MNEVILVDQNDVEVGRAEKLIAHKKGLLHRAFSIFLFNSDGDLLIQKRAANKYHSANLWSNTCCSHPKPNETLQEATKRRLKEELNIETELSWSFSHLYRVEFDSGLIENELDHIFIGTYDMLPQINPDEVSDFKYISISDLTLDIEKHPEDYSFWFKELIEKVLNVKQKMALS